MLTTLKSIVKRVLYRLPYGRLIAHRYTYSFSPRQLAFLIDCVDETASLGGCIVEVGCFLGHTSIWINKHMDFSGIEKPYIAIDTFDGFVPEQLAYEGVNRSKQKDLPAMSVAFRGHSKSMFDRQLQFNAITRVRSIRADAAAFDYAALGPISFALIDVDLYLPVSQALDRIYPLMQKGGIIVVDDCASNQFYDGALQAYDEFVLRHGLERRIEHGKLGVISVGID